MPESTPARYDFLLSRRLDDDRYGLWRVDIEGGDLISPVPLDPAARFDHKHTLVAIGGYLLEWGPLTLKDYLPCYPYRLFAFDPVSKVNRVDISSFLAQPRLPCRACPATVQFKATLHNLGKRKQRAFFHASIGGSAAHFQPVVIKGKVFGKPVAQLLGGFRTKVPTYASGALMRHFPLAPVEKVSSWPVKMTTETSLSRVTSKKMRESSSWTSRRIVPPGPWIIAIRRTRPLRCTERPL